MESGKVERATWLSPHKHPNPRAVCSGPTAAGQHDEHTSLLASTTATAAETRVDMGSDSDYIARETQDSCMCVIPHISPPG